MATEAQAPIKLFYCYAREDQKLRDELDTHLEGLRRTGLITSWYDGELVPGMSWGHAIETHLDSADVILLLVSPAFIKSDYCYGKEMQRAIERHRAKQACVIPILLRPVDWEGAPFAHLQMLPDNVSPITRWADRDEAFVNVARGIRRVVNDMLTEHMTRQQHQVVHSKLAWQVPPQTSEEKLLNIQALSVSEYQTDDTLLQQFLQMGDSEVDRTTTSNEVILLLSPQEALESPFTERMPTQYYQSPEIFGEDPFARWSAISVELEAQRSTQSKKVTSTSLNSQNKGTSTNPKRREVMALIATGGAVGAALAFAGLAYMSPLGQGQRTASTLTPQKSPTVPGKATAKPSLLTPTPTQVQATAESTQPSAQYTGTVISNTTTLALNSASDFTNPTDGSRSLLIHLPNGEFVAAEGACTHEGVQVKYHPDTHTLICPLHGAIFDPANNFKVLQPPAPTPLKAVPIHVYSDGTITA